MGWEGCGGWGVVIVGTGGVRGGAQLTSGGFALGAARGGRLVDLKVSERVATGRRHRFGRGVEPRLGRGERHVDKDVCEGRHRPL